MRSRGGLSLGGETGRETRQPWQERVWTIETVNTTGERAARGRLQETSADVVLVQELKVDQSRVSEHQQAAAKDGRSMACSPALRTSECGFSGGTGIAARWGVGARGLQPMPAEVEWPPQHRFSVKVVDAVLGGGLLFGSVYLKSSEGGFAGVTIGILNLVAQVLRAYGGPFVLGGISTCHLGNSSGLAGRTLWAPGLCTLERSLPMCPGGPHRAWISLSSLVRYWIRSSVSGWWLTAGW